MQKAQIYGCFVRVLHLFFQQNRKSSIVPTGLKFGSLRAHRTRTLRPATACAFANRAEQHKAGRTSRRTPQANLPALDQHSKRAAQMIRMGEGLELARSFCRPFAKWDLAPENRCGDSGEKPLLRRPRLSLQARCLPCLAKLGKVYVSGKILLARVCQDVGVNMVPAVSPQSPAASLRGK